MKRIWIATVILVLPLLVAAQDSPLAGLFDRYLGKPGIDGAVMHPGQPGCKWTGDSEHSAMKEALSQLETVRAMRLSQGSTISPDDFMKKFEKAISKDNYDIIVEFRSGDMEAYLYALRDDTGKTREISMVAKGEDNLMLVAVNGDLDFRRMINPEVMHELGELGGIMMHGKHCGEKHDN